jgi:hypothetical protein
LADFIAGRGEKPALQMAFPATSLTPAPAAGQGAGKTLSFCQLFNLILDFSLR